MRLRWTIVIGVVCLAAGGCGTASESASPTSSSSASDSPATSPATAHTTAPVPVAGKPGSLVYDMSGTEGAGFVTPSGNIACAISTPRSGLVESTTARCDVTSHTYVPPARPRDCVTEFGQTVELDTRARFVCAGDTIGDYVDTEDRSAHGFTAWFDPKANPSVQGRLAGLGYGNSIRVDQVTCTSTRAGVRCRNARTGAGFLIARENYRLTP